MFDLYPKFFGYLGDRSRVIERQLDRQEALDFSNLLRQYPVVGIDDMADEYGRFLRYLIRFGVSHAGLEPLFKAYFDGSHIAWAKGRAAPVRLDEAFGKGKLSMKDVALIRHGYNDAIDLAHYLEASMGLDDGFESMLDDSFGIKDMVPAGRPPTAPAAAGSPAPEPAAAPRRDFAVTAHMPRAEAGAGPHAGPEVDALQPEGTYVLRLGVSMAGKKSLASGNVSVGDVPPQGMQTRWFASAADVEFLPALSSCKVERKGRFWLASFDLEVPAEGESRFEELGIRTAAALGTVKVDIYAAGDNGVLDLYRELTVDLAEPAKVQDDVCTAAGHTLLRTTHEWTTPAVHVQVLVSEGRAHITMLRGAEIKDYSDEHIDWPVTAVQLAKPIDNVRTQLDLLRENWSDYFNAIDAADAAARLPSHRGVLDTTDPKGWQLPDLADAAHRDKFGEVLQGGELRALAHAGYGLYNACFPPGSVVRLMMDELPPGSRVDFLWTEKSGAGMVSHVPWALMYSSLPDVTGKKPVDPEAFLGLRLRVGSKAWSVRNSSRALVSEKKTQAMNLLYWGSKAADEVGVEARWQSAEFGKWGQAVLPDPAQADPKQQIILAIDAPAPAPVGVIYLYCHCGGQNENSVSLRFGDSAQPQDVLARHELSFQPLADAPMIFANACATAQADPFATGVLESIFFGRGVRAFIGTETRVPVQLASRFAWLFFQFFYRRFDASPMSAGEAMVQARMFLWTQYRNMGGLFYSLVNQYDLSFATHEELVALSQQRQ